MAFEVLFDSHDSHSNDVKLCGDELINELLGIIHTNTCSLYLQFFKSHKLIFYACFMHVKISSSYCGEHFFDPYTLYQLLIVYLTASHVKKLTCWGYFSITKVCFSVIWCSMTVNRYIK
jgi:hypothetical protein